MSIPRRSGSMPHEASRQGSPWTGLLRHQRSLQSDTALVQCLPPTGTGQGPKPLFNVAAVLTGSTWLHMLVLTIICHTQHMHH